MSGAGHENDGDRSDRAQLRALLEKIAARAGDPPEHGLEVVDALRRRRGRHRRGAVATAVVLAVAVMGVGWWTRLGDAHDVASVADAGGRLPAELPDVLQLTCTPAGIDVPVASIRPQADGLHLAVDNQLAEATFVWVTADGWSSGRVTVQPGGSSLRQPVAPGTLTVGCRVGDEDQQRQVDLVDVEGLYRQPELSCPPAEQRELVEPRPVNPPTWSLVGATRSALAERVRDDDELLAAGGYPDEQLGDPTVDPTVRIVREGDTMAFVHLASEATAPAAGNVTRDANGGQGPNGAIGDSAVTTRPLGQPWSHVRAVEACTAFLDGPGAPVAPMFVTSAN